MGPQRTLQVAISVICIPPSSYLKLPPDSLQQPASPSSLLQPLYWCVWDTCRLDLPKHMPLQILNLAVCLCCHEISGWRWLIGLQSHERLPLSLQKSHLPRIMDSAYMIIWCPCLSGSVIGWIQVRRCWAGGLQFTPAIIAFAGVLGAARQERQAGLVIKTCDKNPSGPCQRHILAALLVYGMHMHAGLYSSAN